MFTHKTIDVIKNDMVSALKNVESKHNILFNVGRITFTNDNFRCTFKCHSNEEKVSSVLELEWNSFYHLYGFEKEDIYLKVYLNDTVHQVIGLKTSNRKYPVITKNLLTNKQYKWTADRVLKEVKRIKDMQKL